MNKSSPGISVLCQSFQLSPSLFHPLYICLQAVMPGASIITTTTTGPQTMTQTTDRAIFKWVSKVIQDCIATLCDWSRKLTPLAKPKSVVTWSLALSQIWGCLHVLLLVLIGSLWNLPLFWLFTLRGGSGKFTKRVTKKFWQEHNIAPNPQHMNILVAIAQHQSKVGSFHLKNKKRKRGAMAPL